MPVNLFPREKQRMLGVVNVRRLAGGGIEFDDGKMLPGFEFFPAFETDIQPTEMETGNAAANLVDYLGEFRRNAMALVGEFGAAAVVAVWNETDFLAGSGN